MMQNLYEEAVETGIAFMNFFQAAIRLVIANPLVLGGVLLLLLTKNKSVSLGKIVKAKG